jgi:hypothetical protein
VEEPVVLAAQAQAMPGPALLVEGSPEMVGLVASILLKFPDLAENHLQVVVRAVPKEMLTEASVVLAAAQARPGGQAVVEDIREAERTIRAEVPLTVRAQVVADLLLQVPTNNLLLLKAMVQAL